VTFVSRYSSIVKLVSKHTIFVDVASDLGQRVADGWVRAKNVVVLGSVPLLKAGQLGGDSLEEADDDTDWSGLHVIAELVDSLLIRNTVVAVELHLLPDGKKDGGQHEDLWPVL